MELARAIRWASSKIRCLPLWQYRLLVQLKARVALVQQAKLTICKISFRGVKIHPTDKIAMKSETKEQCTSRCRPSGAGIILLGT